MQAKRIASIAAAAALLAVVAAWWWGGRPEALAPGASPGAVDGADAARAPGRNPASGSRVIAIPQPAPAVAPTTAAVSPASLVSNVLRDEIRDAPDLRAYYERVKDQPDATGERSYRLAEAIFECTAFVDKTIDELSVRLNVAKREDNPRRQEVLAAMVNRCRGFSGMGTTLSQVYRDLQRNAEAAGYPAALARALRFEPAARDLDHADAVAIALLTANPDSDVLLEISQYLSMRNGSRWHAQSRIDPQVWSIAWGLLQCSYGADCGPQSRAVVMTCILMSACNLTRVEETVVVQGATQGTISAAAVLRDQLAQRIANRDWAGIGFIERPKQP